MPQEPFYPDQKANFPVARVPVVWMFQPTESVLVPPERLREWEADLLERVGLGFSEGQPVLGGGGTCSFTYSGPSDQAPDDCDVD